MNIVAIDPGPEFSGYVSWSDKLGIISAEKDSNNNIRSLAHKSCVVLIERPDFVSTGSGLSMFNTCFEAGRFFEKFRKDNICITIGRSVIKQKMGKNDVEIRAYLKQFYSKTYLKPLKGKGDCLQAFAMIHYHNSL